MNSFKVLTLNQQNMMYNRIWHFRTMLENFHFFVLFFVKSWKLHKNFGNFFLVVAIWLYSVRNWASSTGKCEAETAFRIIEAAERFQTVVENATRPLCCFFGPREERATIAHFYAWPTYTVQGVPFEKLQHIFSAVCLQFC